MIISIALLILGFVFLIKGADFFVDGASSVAAMLKVSPLIIGLTIVAMGTSLPELSVSTLASINDSNSLAISNAVGSNIFNFLMVLGVTAILTNIEVEEDALRRDFPVSIICAALVIVEGLFFKEITRIGGILHLVTFVFYLLIVIHGARKNAKKNAENEEESGEILPIWKSVIFIIGGAVAIKFGGDWVVSSASNIALFFGLSETLIGLTIVSCGTSLPELVTSAVAAKKGKVDMAVGNAVGSNIFNLLLILGVAGTINPISMISENIYDTAFLLIMSIVTFIFCKTRKRLEKKEGIVMVLCYVAYLVYIILR